MFRVGVTYEEEEKLEGDGAEAHKVEMVKCSNVAEHQIFYNPFPFLHNIKGLLLTRLCKKVEAFLKS